MNSESTVRDCVPGGRELRVMPMRLGNSEDNRLSKEEHSLPNLWEYWPILRRHKWTILSCVAIALLLGIIVSVSAVPVFEAVGRIVINREGDDASSVKASAAVTNSDEDYMVTMDTQTRVLQSDAIAKLTIRKLNLDTDTVFAGKQANRTSDDSGGSSESRTIELHREAALVGKFQKALQVNSVPRTRLLEIRFSSTDGALAAKVVNAAIDTYIEQNYRTHLDATKRTADWLTQQLSELQIKVEESQEKLVRYQQEHGILGMDDKENLITAKLDQLNREVTTAEAERMQKESLYHMAGSGDADLLSNFDPASPLVKLRSQKEDLHRQLAQLGVRFEPTYPAVQELTKQLDSVEQDIAAETKRMAVQYQKEYLAAVEREKLLQASLENQKREANELNENAIQYSLLKRDVDSNRQLYEGLLQKLKEASVMTGLRSSNVRIVDPASTPIVPVSPNVPRNLLVSLMMGVASGVSIVLLIESRENAVYSPAQAETITALPVLAVIPEASRGAAAFMALRRVRQAAPETITSSDPQSGTAEAYRALRTAILLSPEVKKSRVIMITSALPREGKTTTSVNLAIVLAQKSARVLLIEGDMRRGSISKALNLKAEYGLSTILTQHLDAKDAFCAVAGVPGLLVLPAGPVPLYPSETLASRRMQQLVADARQDFDYVVIDSPPVLSVTDAVLLSTLADFTVLVVRAGMTGEHALRRVRKVLDQAGGWVLGLVLNGVATQRHDRYYYGGYQKKGQEKSVSTTQEVMT